MKVLMIGSDKALFTEESESARRHRAYSMHFDQLDVIVFTLKNQPFAVTTLAAGVHVYPTRSRNRFLYPFSAFLLARSLDRPQVVSVQDPFEAGLAGLFASWWHRAPLHVQVHTNFLSPMFVQKSFLNRIRRLIARIVLPCAAHIRVVSEHIKESLEARSSKLARIAVLPIFVDVQKYANLTRTKHPRFKISLLVIARLEKEKRIDRAIDALYAARKAGHDAGLTILGSGKEEGRLKERVRRCGLERYVDFLGWQTDVTPYLAHADLVLVPSDYEGYGLTIVTALAAEVPVLATDVGVAREVGAIVVKESDFSKALLDWIARGPKTASLINYPYASFDEYVDRWVADIRASQKS